jgi:alcohol dehydrogenase class IV
MNPFQLNFPSRVIFGRGKIAEVGSLAQNFGKSILLIHNGDDPGSGGAVDRTVATLKEAGGIVTLRRQRGEPTIADIDLALAAAREARCDVIIAVGGGSSIDAAKATAGLLTNDGSCLDYMEVIGNGRKITQPAAPWIAVPTTAGTGAEATRNAVIGAPECKFKASIRSELLLPRAVLIDPELAVNVPRNVTAASGMDALCQLMESHTSTGATFVTASLARCGLDLIGPNLARVYHNGNDLDAREQMALAAFLSGITLTNAGLGAVHGFAAPLGANFPIPHGVICARLLPLVTSANLNALADLSPSHPGVIKYSEISASLSKGHPSPAPTLPELLHNLVAELNIPPLGTFGLQQSHIPEMVRLAKLSSSMRFNPVILADADLADILHHAL